MLIIVSIIMLITVPVNSSFVAPQVVVTESAQSHSFTKPSITVLHTNTPLACTSNTILPTIVLHILVLVDYLKAQVIVL